jgi:FMN phosphatase YigB (HAD superfamily)
MRPDVVCFDLDGTLYPYEPCNAAGKRAAWRRAHDLGYDDLDRESFEALYQEGRRETKRELAGTASAHERFLYFKRAIQIHTGTHKSEHALELGEAYWDAYVREMELYDDVEAVLQALHGQTPDGDVDALELDSESGVDDREPGDATGVDDRESGDATGVDDRESGDATDVDDRESGDATGVDDRESGDATGVDVAVVTNLTTRIQLKKIHHLGIEPYVDLLTTSEETGREKPSSVMFTLPLAQLDCRPSDAVFVGDDPESDVEGANALGIETVLFDPEHDHESLEGWSRPDHQIHAFANVMDVVR